MARALEEIIKELDAVYTPQKDIYSKQINALPGQQQAEMRGLEASKNDSFEQITTGANRRGVAFGGIPLAEQAKYLGSSYLPAVANLKNRFTGIQSDLAMKLAELGAAQRRDAYSLYESELARDAAAAARASSGGGGGFNFGTLGDTNTSTPTPAKNSVGGTVGNAAQRKDKGFAFTDANGNPVSAAVYSKLNNIDFRALLERMASLGDAGARQALGFVGSDYGYDPNNIRGQGSLYNSLVWGSGLQYNNDGTQSGGGGGGGGW